MGEDRLSALEQEHPLFRTCSAPTLGESQHNLSKVVHNVGFSWGLPGQWSLALQLESVEARPVFVGLVRPKSCIVAVVTLVVLVHVGEEFRVVAL